MDRKTEREAKTCIPKVESATPEPTVAGLRNSSSYFEGYHIILKIRNLQPHQ